MKQISDEVRCTQNDSEWDNEINKSVDMLEVEGAK